MRRFLVSWSLGLAVVGLLVLLVARHLSAQSNVAAELAVLRGLGHPTSLAELVARHPVVPAAENAGPALEAVVDQVIDDGANPTAAALLGDSHPSLRRQPELPDVLREKSGEPARSERL